MFDTHDVGASRKHRGPKFPATLTPNARRQTLHKTVHSSLDILEHSPGEFDWSSHADLTAWVISGCAEVCLDDGRAVTLRPGNAFFMPRGLHGRWVIKEALKTAVVFND